MKAALIERAQAQGLTPSAFARAAIASAIGDAKSVALAMRPASRASTDRVRLSVRLSRARADAARQSSRAAGLTLGDFIAARVVDSAFATQGGRPADQAAALAASCAQLSTLSRNLHHLTNLLRQGSIRAAQEYRETLDNAAGEVRSHLVIASAVVAELRPLLRSRASASDADQPE